MRLVLVICVMGLVSAQTTQAAIVPPMFDSKLIVEDLTKCPVQNVLFDEKDFDTDSLATMPGLLEQSNVTQKCKDEAVSELINCFADGDPSSLQIMTGCCSKACADAINNSVKSGCFAEYVKAICGDPTTLGLRNGLFATGKRCANFGSTCKLKDPAAKAANVTAAAANATAANVTAGSRAAAAASANTTDTAAAKPADAPTVAASSTAKSGALGAAATTILTCMLAGVALLAALQ